MAQGLDFGIVGTGVMGKNLALNIADHGFSVGVWNREADMLAAAVAGSSLVAHDSLKALSAALARPRRILMMIKAGAPVDSVIEQLAPLLDPGDILIDGGNSHFDDTERREATLQERGIHFFGMGVSGGEDGARHGPSLMPGGSREAYERVRPVLEAIAAKTESGACVTWVGPGGAGHFVKMVHNGIEYADMQCIAEAYHLLREIAGHGPPELASVFEQWNAGPLESFLIEISAKIFRVPDPETGGWLVDQVLDQAEQKGTGRWTAQTALELGVAIPSIAAAIDARVMSSLKAARLAASRRLPGPSGQTAVEDRKKLVRDVHDALLASKICAYAQGLSLIRAASTHKQWNIDLGELARIWKGGCIIRARFLDTIMRAHAQNPELENLLLDDTIIASLNAAQPAWRRMIALGIHRGLPLPAMTSSAGYYDAYRLAALPQNLTQAQRDAFGAHGYRRKSAPERGPLHTDWLE